MRSPPSRTLTHGAGADLTLDTSGTAAGRLVAVRGARTWGTACFVGEGGDVTIDVSPEMLRKQLTIVARGLFPRPSRPIARALSPTAKSTSIICSRTAGGSTKPTRPTGCSTSRPAARVCS